MNLKSNLVMITFPTDIECPIYERGDKPKLFEVSLGTELGKNYISDKYRMSDL